MFVAGLPAEASLMMYACEGGRDGRVVDGGGLETLIGDFLELAIFPLKAARDARWGSKIESCPVAS